MEVVFLVDIFKDFHLLQSIFLFSIRVEPDLAVWILRMKGFEKRGGPGGYEVFCRDEVGRWCVVGHGGLEKGSDGAMARNKDVLAKKVCPLLDKVRQSD